MNAFYDKAADDQARQRICNSVLRQLAMLKSMGLEQLREKWLDLCGAEAPKYKKQFLIKRLGHRIQELFYGGLSERAKAHLRRVASNDPVATVKRRIPEECKHSESILPGTRLVRVWNDRRYEVVAQPEGFEYDGRIFKSLSAAAREITSKRQPRGSQGRAVHFQAVHPVRHPQAVRIFMPNGFAIELEGWDEPDPLQQEVAMVAGL
jgi:hypothetical protein